MGRRPRRASRRRRWRWRSLPQPLRALGAVALLCGLTIAYQVLRKPTELLGVLPASPKTPSSTWAAYGALFRAYSTDIVRPELLAALVQVESAGDPLARTYWRWRLGWNPLELYAPASTGVGLLQITDGTFADARHLCVRDHKVVREGPWREPPCSPRDRLRLVPGDAIEMTSAWLDRSVREALRGAPARATPEQRRRLAAVIHLCGRGRGDLFTRRRFRA